jgi:hypothetical protein
MLSINPKSSCSIKNNCCIVDGKIVFQENPSLPIIEYLNLLYKKMELNYPKFFKMDTLCKLGLLTAELLLKELGEAEKTDTAIYLYNKASSLETDRKHYSNIQSKDSYFPSPSVFVYTLPNIVIGEISIKHKIMGEGVFFLSESYNFEWLQSYAHMAINMGIAKHILIGRVESDNNIAEAELQLIRSI